jgi:hypothetical protein
MILKAARYCQGSWALERREREHLYTLFCPSLFSESQDSPLEKMGEVACRSRQRHPNLSSLFGWDYKFKIL